MGKNEGSQAGGIERRGSAQPQGLAGNDKLEGPEFSSELGQKVKRLIEEGQREQERQENAKRGGR